MIAIVPHILEITLNKKDQEILLIVQEECAEVTQAISKCFRFGIDTEYKGKTNHQRLTEEIGDLLCMINLMIEKKIIPEVATHKASLTKRNKLRQWSNIFDDEEKVH
jgi:NTP pyrophosphatase (non-canonical NTP hydrolase)